MSSPLFLPEERLGKPYGNGWTAIRCLEYLEATLNFSRDLRPRSSTVNHSVDAWFAIQPSRLVETNKVGV